MDTVTLLQHMKRSGFEVRVASDGQHLKVSGPKGLEYLVAELRQQKAEALALLRPTPEVRWRMDVMRPQVPRTGPIRFLVARPEVQPRPGHCLSCGDPLRPGEHFRCRPCQQATAIVLDEIREGMV